ncbi:MAG: helix-turn-helix domain-containing protein [bacterium]|nr:helix-turn-helix domain-containing protein [bacterium]
MTAFQKKNVRGTETLGERLRTVREEIGLTLEKMAADTGIQEHYLSAIEASAYDRMPGGSYARSFVRRYAERLELNTVSVLQTFDREYHVLQQSRRLGNSVPTSPSRLSSRHFISIPKLLRRGAVVLIIGTVFAYLGYTLFNSVSAPELRVDQPAESVITDEYSITIAGQVERESKLQINGQEIFSDSEGRFQEQINLQSGVNIIEITAYKKRGQSTTVYRKVLVNTT